MRSFDFFTGHRLRQHFCGFQTEARRWETETGQGGMAYFAHEFVIANADDSHLMGDGNLCRAAGGENPLSEFVVEYQQADGLRQFLEPIHQRFQPRFAFADRFGEGWQGVVLKTRREAGFTLLRGDASGDAAIPKILESDLAEMRQRQMAQGIVIQTDGQRNGHFTHGRVHERHGQLFGGINQPAVRHIGDDPVRCKTGDIHRGGFPTLAHQHHAPTQPTKVLHDALQAMPRAAVAGVNAHGDGLGTRGQGRHGH